MFYFKIGQRVKFKDSFFQGIVDKSIACYRGHEYVIAGYLIDTDGREIKDHLLLRCSTGSVEVQGAIHDTDIELVSAAVEPVLFSAIQPDPLLSYELMNAGTSLTEGLSGHTPAHEIAAPVAENMTIGAHLTETDWTDIAASIVPTTAGYLSSSIGSVADVVGDTIGGIADGLGDVASGLGDILGSIDL